MMDNEERLRRNLQRIRNNNFFASFQHCGDGDYIQNMTNENWEQLGHDIANNTHIKKLLLYYGALNDQRISFLFRGLKRSSSIEEVWLYDNGLSVAGVQSMVPFLQNANNLTYLNLSNNNLQTEGFNVLFSALRDSPIERIHCCRCGIESIEIDSNTKPKRLKFLFLDTNSINDDGCRGLANLLQGEDSVLTTLHLNGNMIDDEGVSILVNALQSNITLTSLSLTGNIGISKLGKIRLLKLVNDISSIKATLESNHTLRNIGLELYDEDSRMCEIVALIRKAEYINNFCNAAEAKVIRSQLHSESRAELAKMQGLSYSLYSEINPLHLPEVLALVGRHHGQEELYMALKSSIAELTSTVNRKECLKQRIAEYRNKIEAAEAEIAAIEVAKVHEMDAVSDESRSSNKRRRS